MAKGSVGTPGNIDKKKKPERKAFNQHVRNARREMWQGVQQRQTTFKNHSEIVVVPPKSPK